MSEWDNVNGIIGPDAGSLGGGIWARKANMDPVTDMEMTDGGGSGGWDWGGLGSWLGDNASYLLRAKVDAEYKQPFQLAQRQMDVDSMKGDVDGGSINSGIHGGLSPMWMLGGAGALVLLVLLLKD
ncbi:hypothetical protein OL229_05205 [Neisseriaceae bacterium JH1-16]|nr:hypothetical protein [Neisseriaceae bacterium JH1-16]